MTPRRTSPPAETAPGSTASLRPANRRRVLDVLRGTPSDGDPITQTELARVTGLASATVSNIVRGLADAGLVETEPGSGRRSTTVRLSRRAGLVAGVDFGHSHVAVGLGDLTGTVIDEVRRPLDSRHSHTEGLAAAAAMLDGLLAEHVDDGQRVRMVGLGVPAPVADDVVRSSAILPGWVGVHARSAAEEQFGVPVRIENDANLGALAEHRVGVARGSRSSVFVKISSGVGAGIIIEDRLFHGTGGTAGELGHLTLDEQGPVCRCGSRGCLETYASVENVLSMMAPQLPGATLESAIAAARDGNVLALRVFEDAGMHLGWGLASVVNLLNPALVVIGGDMARAGDLLLDSARIGLRRHALDSVATTPVVASELGERASLVGAMLIAAELTDPVLDVD